MPAAIQVAAGILRQSGEVLVCQRNSAAAHAGKWEFPGGKIEPGETPAECLRREIREELGVEATIGALIVRHRHAYPGGPTVDLHFFDVEAFEGEIVNRVFAAVRWLRPEQLDSVDLLDADRPVVDALCRRSRAQTRTA